ncbi:hypothetical protein Emag_000554 [Eimeria magna]
MEETIAAAEVHACMSLCFCCLPVVKATQTQQQRLASSPTQGCEKPCCLLSSSSSRTAAAAAAAAVEAAAAATAAN